MERRIRSLHRQPLARPEPFLKYLKPGALARMRDSRISARSHRFCTIPQMSSPQSSNGQPSVNMTDGFPCFSGRLYGPRCPQRKKLVASKAVLLPSSSQSVPVSDLPDPVVDVFSSDSNIVAAHR